MDVNGWWVNLYGWCRSRFVDKIVTGDETWCFSMTLDQNISPQNVKGKHLQGKNILLGQKQRKSDMGGLFLLQGFNALQVHSTGTNSERRTLLGNS